MRRVLGALGAVLVLWALSPPASVPARGAESPDVGRHADRVLVVSLPAISWADIDPTTTPHLRRLAEESAVASLITRVGSRRSSLGNGYLSLGAGARASVDGARVADAFDADEPVGAGTESARDVYTRRTGRSVRDGLLHLAIPAITDDLAGSDFDAEAGAFGDALERAAVRRAVIANADGVEPDTGGGSPTGTQRAAVAALMNGAGVVPDGDVSAALLTPEADMAFGVGLDIDAVDREFRKVWRAHSVVLFEGSDLVRADRYRSLTDADGARAVRAAALARTDAIVARLLESVDLRRDAVVIAGPAAASDSPTLPIAAVRAPGVEPGLLRSGTTRRAGVVHVVDVAPTVLRLLALDSPAIMEGRAMTVVRGAGSGADRIESLVNTNRDSQLRDQLLEPATMLVVILTGVLALAAAVAIGRRSRPRFAALVELLALAVLGFLLATYVANLLHFAGGGGALAYWAFVTSASVVFAALCQSARQHHPLDPLLLALGSTVALHVADLVTGARLEYNAVFGYSPTVGIRVAGQGNITFAQLGAATLLLAGILAARVPTAPGRRLALTILGVVLVVMAAPMWGQDFGAAVAGAPAFALLAWLLIGGRIRLRAVGVLAAILVGSGLLVGFLDLLRPANQRTHIGRFFEKVGDDGLGGFMLVIRRKLDANLASFGVTRLLWVLPIVAMLAVFCWHARRDHIDRLLETPSLRGALLAVGALALLGYALNDSGVAIPAMIAVVALCASVYVATPDARTSDSGGDSQAGSATPIASS